MQMTRHIWKWLHLCLNRLYLYIYVYIRTYTHIESVWTDVDDSSYLKMTPSVPEPTLYIHICIYTHIYREGERVSNDSIYSCNWQLSSFEIALRSMEQIQEEKARNEKESQMTLFIAATDSRPLSKSTIGLWSRSKRRRRAMRKRRRRFSKARGGAFILHLLSTTMKRWYISLFIHTYISRGYTYIYIKGGRIYFAPLIYNNDKVIYIQPIALGVSFLHSQISIDDLVL